MKIRINQDNTITITQADKYEHKTLGNYLNRFTKNFRFDPRFKMRIWDGKVHFYDATRTIPLGLWREVYRCCMDFGYPFEVENKDAFPINRQMDREDYISWVNSFFADRTDKKGNKFFPYDYQTELAFAVLRNRYGLTEVATGGGKSLLFAMVVFYLMSRKQSLKSLLIVPSMTLVTQFYDDLVDYNWGYHKENSNPLRLDMVEMMSDKPRKALPGSDPNVYVSTYQTLANYPPEWFNQFNCVTIDEAHTAKTSTLQKIMKSCSSAYYRFGMSGTFPGKDTSEILSIMSVTGPILDKVKAHELMKLGTISKVKVKAITLYHGDPEFHDRVLVIRKGDGKNAYDAERNKVQTEERRIEFIAKLCAKSPKNIMVMFNNKDHGAALFKAIEAKGCRIYYIDGDTPNKERNRIKAMMENTDNVGVLVASYGTLSTGVSIKAITNVVLADSFKSEQRILQTIGRALRLHAEKDFATIFDLVDRFDDNMGKKNNVLYDHFLHRKRMYSNEKYPLEEIKIYL